MYLSNVDCISCVMLTVTNICNKETFAKWRWRFISNVFLMQPWDVTEVEVKTTPLQIDLSQPLYSKGMFHSHTHIQIITIDGRIDLEKSKIKALHFATGRSPFGSVQTPSPANKYARLCRAQETVLFIDSIKARVNIKINQKLTTV